MREEVGSGRKAGGQYLNAMSRVSEDNERRAREERTESDTHRHTYTREGKQTPANTSGEGMELENQRLPKAPE